MDDTALVESAREGDREAFTAIYDRYADSIHAFAFSVLRDRHEAADVTQDTFLLAAEKLGQLRDPSKLRSWLFAIARHRALRQGSRRARTVLTGEDADMPAVESAPDEPARQEELQRLVWDAADGLAERDRAILDLNLRHGLEGQELAEVLGVEPGHVYVMVNRLKEQVERSLGALLVARHGRSACEELDGLLENWDGKLSPLLRKRVARHVDSCEICSEGRKKLASPLALLAAIPLLVAPAEVRDQVLTNLQLVSSSRPAPGWRSDGFPPGIEGGGNRRRGVAAIVAGIAALVVGALLLAPTYNDSPSNVALEASATTVLSGSTALRAAGGAAPGVPAPSEGSVAPPPLAGSTGSAGPAPAPGGAPPGGGSAGGSPPGAAPGGTDGGTDVPTVNGSIVIPTPANRPSPPPDTQAPALTLSTSASGCTATLIASVTDESPISVVTATWRNPDGSISSATMTPQRVGYYTVTVGPYAGRVGAVSWSATASDSRGNAATADGPTVSVATCSPTGGP